MKEAVEAAVRAVLSLRVAERLLASSGFYGEADRIRQERIKIEKCSTTSVESLIPDHGEYAPETIGKVADRRDTGDEHSENIS